MRGKPALIKLTDRQGSLISPYWYIHYYEGRGKRISTGCLIGAQDHEATVALAAFILEREKPLAREPDKLMVAQALNDYYEEHAKHLASSVQAKYSEKKLNEYFGSKYVAHITPSSIAAYVREWQEHGQSNGTIRRDLQHLQAALNHEVHEQRLIYAPKIKMPPPPKPRERILSQTEIEKLIDHCKTPHVKAFVQIMINTGQRPASVENLKWFQVDFENGIIWFDRDGKQETTKRKRPVPMSDVLYSLLTELYKEKKTEYVLEYKGEHAGCVRKAFERTCEHAGLKDVSRYTLRHTFANMLDSEGIDEKSIGELMGHMRARTTRTHYIKANMQKMRGAVNVINCAKTTQEKDGK